MVIKKDLTLLIMAAGMGSRFSGLKQVNPVGPNGEFIIDYSIYDAMQAGFNKVIFIIKEEHLDIFKETIGNRIKGIQVEYVFQKTADLPLGYENYSNRKKPWGTAHAVWSGRKNINEPFAVISADDFYGRQTFIELAKFLSTNTDMNTYGVIAHKAINTIPKNTSVNRGILFEENNYLKRIVECKIEHESGNIIANPYNGTESFIVDENTNVTMITYGFYPDFFNILEDEFEMFLDEHKEDSQNFEYFIPDVVQKQIDNNKKQMQVIPTTSKWYGITYQEDVHSVKEAILNYIENGEYPTNLWN